MAKDSSCGDRAVLKTPGGCRNLWKPQGQASGTRGTKILKELKGMGKQTQAAPIRVNAGEGEIATPAGGAFLQGLPEGTAIPPGF